MGPLRQQSKLSLILWKMLLGAVEGTDLNITGASDLEWRPRDVLLEFDDENVTRPETPPASSTPAQPSMDAEMLSPLESPGTKKLCLRESTAAQLAKSVAPLALKPDYSEKELVGYT